jgi:hypothetical protein
MLSGGECESEARAVVEVGTDSAPGLMLTPPPNTTVVAGGGGSLLGAISRPVAAGRGVTTTTAGTPSTLQGSETPPHTPIVDDDDGEGDTDAGSGFVSPLVGLPSSPPPPTAMGGLGNGSTSAAPREGERAHAARIAFPLWCANKF